RLVGKPARRAQGGAGRACLRRAARSVPGLAAVHARAVQGRGLNDRLCPLAPAQAGTQSCRLGAWPGPPLSRRRTERVLTYSIVKQRKRNRPLFLCRRRGSPVVPPVFLPPNEGNGAPKRRVTWITRRSSRIAPG